MTDTGKITNALFGDQNDELYTHKLSFIVEKLYNFFKASKRRSFAKLFFKILFKLEGDQYRSATVRKLLKRDYLVDIGVHSYGELFIPGAFSPSVIIGNYTSVGRGVRVFTQNHPTDTLSTHPYFYEKKFGIVNDDTLEPATLIIGHDVWIGQNAILLPGCKEVGIGAIIGAGAIVTKSVPNYAIVAGNPAKIIKYRFNEDKQAQLLDSKWWMEPVHKLRKSAIK